MTKEDFNAKLETLIDRARHLRVSGFGEQEPEEATKSLLLEPFFQALGYLPNTNCVREFKILGDSVDYLLKSDRPLMFVEAKSLHDCPNASLFDKHRDQVHAVHPKLPSQPGSHENGSARRLDSADEFRAV